LSNSSHKLQTYFVGKDLCVFFDGSYKNDEKMIKFIYGNKNNWVDITNSVEDFKDMFPKTYKKLLDYYKNK